MTSFTSAMRYEHAVDLLRAHASGELAEAVEVVLDGEPEAEALADQLEEAEEIIAELRELIDGRKTVSAAKVLAVLDRTT